MYNFELYVSYNMFHPRLVNFASFYLKVQSLQLIRRQLATTLGLVYIDAGHVSRFGLD